MSIKNIKIAGIVGTLVALTTGCGATDGAMGADSNSTVKAEQPVLLGSSNLDYTQCANENGTCLIGTGGRYMAYGANGKFNYKFVNAGTVNCNYATFGDPIQGTVKACYYANFANPVAQNAKAYAYNQYVAYGANGTFNFKRIYGQYTCNDATFGSPISGTKQCFTALPGYSYKMDEGQSFNFGTATYAMAFGANGNYYFKNVTGAVTCDRTTFGGDPVPNVAKACYLIDAWYVADEGGSFNMNGKGYTSCTAYYSSGQHGNMLTKSAFSGTCSSSFFGGDPDWGISKKCFAYCQTIY